MELALTIAIAVILFNTWKVMTMGTGIEELKAQVAGMSTVVDSAVGLIEGIADKIDEAIAADDAAEDGELAFLADSLREDATRLGDAVAANTAAKEETPPADPAPVEEPAAVTADADRPIGAEDSNLPVDPDNVDP